MSQRLPVVSILGVLLLFALACAGPPKSRQDAAALSALQGSRVVVAPLNLGIRRAPALDQKSGAVARELVDFLQARGAEVQVLSQPTPGPTFRPPRATSRAWWPAKATTTCWSCPRS